MATKPDKTKLKVCQYGENCYRKNPIHFSEYSHPHLDKIYEKGINPQTKKYDIPDEYDMSSDIIVLQLKLLEKVFPKAEKKQTKTTTTQNTTQSQNGGYRLGSTKESETVTVTKQDEVERVERNKSPVPSTSSAAVKQDNSNLRKKPRIDRNIKDYIAVVLEKGKMAEKLEKSAPYNFFLTAITDCKQTHHEPLTVTLQEIFDESLGEVESTAQINFMVDIGWLLGHYYFAGILDKPLLVLYGDDMPELATISKHKPQITAIKVNMPTPFATSHTKMMLIGYKDGSMRVVISTANLYEDDWNNRTQGIWISPKLDPLPEDADTVAGESPTKFRQDLLLYLVEYKIAALQPWINRIRRTDFGAINVFLVCSVPGGFFEGPRGHPWGHARLNSLLKQHATKINYKIPVICQSSSIGSLGANVQAWIQHDFLNSLRKDSESTGLQQIPPFKMIYPSYGNVSNSHDGMLGGGCLPYSKNTNDKQPWLREYLHQWRSNARYRTHAMPHIKSYTRVNLEEEEIYWFVLTSANLSKAAWGSFNKNVKLQPCLRIANYEAGVLFLPRFVTGEETFPLGKIRDGIPPFPLPYDVPLTPYAPDDKPFLMDYLH
ncbi:probable tyrosyl-DNA phosphodiesterase [Teleopsis dalmanni]|uniref:probable tyrosyl-DNA phosphodiesterase n=1 Tax=Teleopsis dalmanni TaxID=139649 RepID=UPI0018CE8E5A|nr:probable tyrosyl-DNA phosphodiesterase [Teleopsis dalmanni]